MAIGSLWKADDKFVVQFSNVKPREKSVIFSSFKEWKESGSGFHKDGTELLLFSNQMLDEEKVFSLVKSLPFPFTEEKKNGDSKKIRTQHKNIIDVQPLTRSQNHAKIAGGRACSKCGHRGHNSRTCKNDVSQ